MQPETSEQPLVIGLGLEEASQLRLREAFRGCLFYGAGERNVAAARRRCLVEDWVTCFVKVSEGEQVGWSRVSLLFDQVRVKVIGVCAKYNDALGDTMLHHEFSGAIERDASVQVYRRAARAVQQGELWFSRRALARVMREFLSSPARLELSERETAILELMLAGTKNQQIGEQLYITRETVRWHLKSLYAKLGVSDRESACRYASNTVGARGGWKSPLCREAEASQNDLADRAGGQALG